MKPLNLFIATLIFPSIVSITGVSAQSNRNQNKINLGFDASIGITTHKSPFGYGLGLDIFAKYKASDELNVIASVGYGRLLTKDTSPTADYDFIPAKAGVKVFPILEPVYLLGSIGAGFGLKTDSKTALIFGGGAGYEWNNEYDLSLRYEGYQQNKNSATYQPLNGQFMLVFSYNF